MHQAANSVQKMPSVNTALVKSLYMLSFILVKVLFFLTGRCTHLE